MRLKVFRIMKKFIFLLILIIGIVFSVSSSIAADRDNLKRGLKQKQEMSLLDVPKISLKDWKRLPGEIKERLKRNYRRFKSLPPERRRIIMERYKRFKQLSLKERWRIIQNFRRWQKLPPERRQQLRRLYKKWQQLPPYQKKLIKERLTVL